MNHMLLNKAINWTPAPRNIGGVWLLADFYGDDFPTTFKTKAQALAVGDRHHQSVLKAKPWKAQV